MIEQMLTLFPKEIDKMDRGELESELRAQKWLYTMIRHERGRLEIASARKKYSWIRENKIEFCELYLKNLEALIEQIKYYIPLRAYEGEAHYFATRRSEAKKAKVMEERKHRYNQVHTDKRMQDHAEAFLARDGVDISYDRDKFHLVARDRGYLTEEGIVYAVSKELGLKRPAALRLIEKGKFSWGQVMCLGAMFEMTPKEFCDIFLAGYFVEKYGEFRASYDNIDKTMLLKRVDSLTKDNLL